MKRIGLIGNSCTGKSTAAFSIIKLLKMRRCLTSYVTDVCRFVRFNPEKFDTDPNARLHVLHQQIANECEQMVRPDADYLITERTALDWWLYYMWTCKNVGQQPLESIENMVSDWSAGYDLLLFMDSQGMIYVNDGFRPASTKIRDEIDSMYAWLYNRLPLSRTRLVHGSSLEERNELAEAHVLEWLNAGNLIVRPSRVLPQ